MTRQRGNILFLILLAVVLFAALAYAVTSSMRGGGKSGGAEKASMQGAAIIQDATNMVNGINRMMLVDDCKASELSFQNDVDTNYENTNTRANGACKLFAPTGGGLAYALPDPNAMDPAHAGVASGFNGKWYFFNAGCVRDVGTIKGVCHNNGTTSDSDLIAYLPFIKKDVCLAINDGLGIPRRDGTEPPINSGDVISFNNTYRYKGAFYSWGAGSTFHLTVYSPYMQLFANLQQGCFEVTSDTSGSAPSGRYMYFAVLLAR